MSQYGWTACPDSVRVQIDELVAAVREALGENLVGVYLHGSLALGCFNPERSDVDLIVVTRQGMTVETKRSVAEILLHCSNAPAPVEISFLPEAYMNPWQYPTPFDFHYGEDWREKTSAELSSGEWKKWNDAIRKDDDLAAHITILLESGIVLCGRPIDEVFPPVPKRHYVDSIVKDFEWGRDRIEKYPASFVLNACRVSAYLREGRICSKEQAGAWALSIVNDEFGELVNCALQSYRENRKDERFDRAVMERFAAYMADEIGALLEQS